MKYKHYLSTMIVVISMLITACQQGNNSNTESRVILSNSSSFSEQDIQQLSAQACAMLDKKSTMLPAHSRYHARLNTITPILGYQVNDIALNYQIYYSSTINALAMANGCVRINSGLMDVMNNDEVLAVLAHELGHIALDHKRKAFQASHQIETYPQTNEVYIVVDKQFSYEQEIEADNYALTILIQQGIRPDVLLTMFSKLNQSCETNSAHPPLATRRQNIIEKINTISTTVKERPSAEEYETTN